MTSHCSIDRLICLRSWKRARIIFGQSPDLELGSVPRACHPPIHSHSPRGRVFPLASFISSASVCLCVAPVLVRLQLTVRRHVAAFPMFGHPKCPPSLPPYLALVTQLSTYMREIGRERERGRCASRMCLRAVESTMCSGWTVATRAPSHRKVGRSVAQVVKCKPAFG